MVINKKNIQDIPKEIYNQAIKDGIIFNDNVNLFFLEKKSLIGFVGLIVKKTKAFFKCDYILPEFRNKGYYKILFLFRINLCKEMNIKVLEANCTKMSINYYLKNGFKIKKKYKNGITKVMYENL